MSKTVDRVLVIREILKSLDMTRTQLCTELEFDSNSPLVEFELNGNIIFGKRLANLLRKKSLQVPPLIMDFEFMSSPCESSNSSSCSSSEEIKVPPKTIPPYTWFLQGRAKTFRRTDQSISVNLKFHSNDKICLLETLKLMVPDSQFKARSRPKVHIIIESGTGRVPYDETSLFDKLAKKSEHELVVLFLTWSPNGDPNLSDTFSRFFGSKFMIIRLGKFENQINYANLLIPFISGCLYRVPLAQLSQLDVLDLPKDYIGDIKLVE